MNTITIKGISLPGLFLNTKNTSCPYFFVTEGVLFIF